ncbi:MAG: hypothetical protein IJ766_04045 [Clostridia bacterium]|nr:hypothetical protein [Clostridia bacterium]
MKYVAVIWALAAIAGFAGFLVKFKHAKIGKQDVVYLPKFLFFFGAALYFGGAAFGTVMLLMDQPLPALLAGGCLLLIGVAAMLCQINQKVTVTSANTFVSRSFLGNEKEYRFSDCLGVKIHTDSVTFYMQGGKIHMESMAYKDSAFIDRLLQYIDSDSVQTSGTALYFGDEPDDETATEDDEQTDTIDDEIWQTVPVKHGNRRKEKTQTKKEKLSAADIAVLLALVAVFLIEILPAANAVRDLPGYDIVYAVMKFLSLLYFTWKSKLKPHAILEKLLLTVGTGAYLFASLMFSGQVSVIVLLLFLYALIGCAVRHFFQEKRYSAVTNAVTGIIALIALASWRAFNYVDNPDGIHFWKVALPAALVFGFLAALVLVTGVGKLKDNRRSERICFPLLVAFAAFILVVVTCADLNYALDRSDPTAYQTVVADKHSSGGRSPSYYLSAEVNGEERAFDVGLTTYDEYEVGDEMTVVLYEGAFHDPYYLISATDAGE